eukprot:9468944-Pyramimonas_sp.AAC.1
MASSTFEDEVEATFSRVAVDLEGYPSKVLPSPGLAGLHVFLTGCSNDDISETIDVDKLSVQALSSIFDSQGWSVDMSFTLADLKVIVTSSGAVTSGNCGMSESFVHLMDIIQDRESKGEFPIVRPAELGDVEEQSAASQSLGLVEKMDAVKLQSYLDYQKAKYFESSPGDSDVPIRLRHARWAYTFYYQHVREYLANESLNQKSMAHHFHGSTFVPLIPPQSLGDEEQKREAFASIAKMERQDLVPFNKNLWEAWGEIAEVVEMTGGDGSTAFKQFLEEDYFCIMSSTCDSRASASEGLHSRSAQSFQPMVEPGFQADAAEKRAREELIMAASLDVHTKAVQAVADEYTEYVNSRSLKQRNLLPETPPPKFAAPRYYDSLQRLVKEATLVVSRSAQEVDGPVGGVCAAPALALGDPASSGIDLILSGNAFTAPSPTVETVVYMSAIDILQSGNDGSKCKFQAVLAVCESVPRDVKYTEGSPRKRKAGDADSSKAADIILVDKTG